MHVYNLSTGCHKPDALYATQRRFQIHCIEQGWESHHNLQIWNFWKVKPCLCCLNKYSKYLEHTRHRQQSTSNFTASDVQWIDSNNFSNLCERCTAETNNDPNKSIEQLEKNNRWARTNALDINDINKLIDGKRNYIAALLQTDTARQIYGQYNSELPSILEIINIRVEQVEKIPGPMLGRIKILLNKILYNINQLTSEQIEKQVMYLKQLEMLWKIISQKRVKSNDTYNGYTTRSNMDFTLKLLETEQWARAWDNMNINKITRNVHNTDALNNFNDMLHNIKERQCEYEYMATMLIEMKA